MIPRTRDMMLACILIGVLVAAGCNNDSSPIDSLTDPTVQPRVIFTLPANGSEGPYELYAPGPSHNFMPHFVVRFNKLIRISSLHATSVRVAGFDRRVSVIPYPENYYRPDGAKATPRGTEDAARAYEDVFDFLIIDSATYPRTSSYDVGQIVTVTLGSTIEDINGNRLEPFTFSFKPEPVFRVTESVPENGATGFNPFEGNLYVFFNTKCAGDITSTVALSPIMVGQWILASFDSTYLYFETNPSWPYGTEFYVTIGASAHDRHGNTLSHAYTSSFTTHAFQVSSASPQGNSISLISGMYCYFSGPVDTGTIRSAFTLSPAANGNFSMSPGSRYFSFWPHLGLTPNTLYTVGLSTNLRASSGEPLASAYSFQFTTDSFRISYTDPSNGYENVARSTTIYIRANSQLDVSAIPGALSISPSVAGALSGSQGQPGVAGYFIFYPSVPLSARTTYTVTVKTNLMTATGHLLLRPYSLSFTTSD